MHRIVDSVPGTQDGLETASSSCLYMSAMERGTFLFTMERMLV